MEGDDDDEDDVTGYRRGALGGRVPLLPTQGIYRRYMSNGRRRCGRMWELLYEGLSVVYAMYQWRVVDGEYKGSTNASTEQFAERQLG